MCWGLRGERWCWSVGEDVGESGGSGCGGEDVWQGRVEAAKQEAGVTAPPDTLVRCEQRERGAPGDWFRPGGDAML